MSNVFLVAFGDSLNAIKKNLRIVLVLLLLEIGFMALLGSVQLHYQFQIFEKSQEFTDYMNQLPLEDTESILQQKDIFGDNPALIFEGAQAIRSALYKLAIFTVLIILFFNLVNWALTEQLFNKKKKEWLEYAGKFIVVAAVYSIIYVALISIFLETSLSDYLIEEAAHLRIVPSLVLLAVAYFMFISFALVGRTKLKDIAKKTFEIGFKKAHWMLSTYAVNIALIVLFGYFFFRSGGYSYSILVILGIFFLAAFVWGRIFVVATIARLRN